jgi:hypothetical protein
MFTEEEMMKDLAAADAAGDFDLAKVIASKIKEARGTSEFEQDVLENGLTPTSPMTPETMATGGILEQYMGGYQKDLLESVDPNAMVDSQERVSPANIYTGEREIPHIKQAVQATTQDAAFAQSDSSFSDYLSGKFSDMGKGISTAYGKRVDMASESIRRGMEGEQTGFETALQLGGDTAGMILDGVGTVVVEALDTAGDAISLVMPDYAEGVIKEGAKDAFDAVMNSDAGKAGMAALVDGMEAYSEWAANDPRMADNLESVINIAALVSPVKGKPTPTAKTSVTSKIDDAANKLLKPAAKRKENVKNIKVLETFLDTEHTADIYKRTGTNNILTLTPMEQKAVDVLPTVKGYKMSNTSTAQRHNARVLFDEIKATSEGLQETLVKAGGKVNDYDLFKNMDSGFKGLIKDSVRKDEVTNIVTQLSKDVQEAININGKSPAGIWKARKSLDDLKEAAVKKAGMGGWDKAGPEAQAFKIVRDAFNKSIDDAVPGTQKTLDRISAMKYVQEPLSKEAAKKAGNFFTNVAGDVGKMIGAQRDWAFAIGALAGGTIGYATLGPVVGAGVVGGYAAYKATKLVKYGLSSESRKQYLGTALKAIDQSMKLAKEKGATEMVKELRAHRAGLIEIVNDGVERWENGGKEEYEKDNALTGEE